MTDRINNRPPTMPASTVACALAADVNVAQECRSASPVARLSLAESIHYYLSEEHLAKPRPTSLEKLQVMLKDALSGGKNPTEGKHATQFANITRTANTTNSDSFELVMENQQTVTRTQDEIELHVLLQTQVRAADASYGHTGDSIDPDRLIQLPELWTDCEPTPAAMSADNFSPRGSAEPDTAENNEPTPRAGEDPDTSDKTPCAIDELTGPRLIRQQPEPLCDSGPSLPAVYPDALSQLGADEGGTDDETLHTPREAVSLESRDAAACPANAPLSCTESADLERVMASAASGLANGSGSAIIYTPEPGLPGNRINFSTVIQSGENNRIGTASIARPAAQPIFQAAATPPATDCAVDKVEDAVWIYTNNSANIGNLCNLMNGPAYSTHYEKQLSGQSAHCWWRAGISVAVLQHEPEALENLLNATLGETFSADAANIRQMAEAAHRDGPEAIFTSGDPDQLFNNPGNNTHTPHDKNIAHLEFQSKLMLPGQTASEVAEDSCQRIVDGLLNRAGVPDNERHDAIFGEVMGTDEMLMSLLNLLHCDVFFLRADSDYSGLVDEGGRIPIDYSNAEVRWRGRPNSGLVSIQPDDSREKFASNIAQGAKTVPGIFFRDLHCSVWIPRALAKGFTAIESVE